MRFFSKLFFLSIITIASVSCNSDSDTEVTTDYSKNAQISNFTLTAIARTSADTVNYAVLAKTRFSIDQLNQNIYNPDPLPYKTTLKKFFPTFTFAVGYTLTVEVNYLGNNVSVLADSLVTWNSTDSIDFSKKLQLIVTPISGDPKRTYDVNLRVYQNDPDSIIWNNSLPQLPITGNSTKTFILDNNFYTFVGSTSALKLYTSPIKDALVWKAETLSSQPSGAIVKNMVYANNKFYVLDSSNKIYTSSDQGLTWTTIANTDNVTLIYGLLPKRTSEPLDEFLVLLDDNTFAKTTDLTTINKITSLQGGYVKVPDALPRSYFSVYTNDQENNRFNNQLIIVGGYTKTGQLTNTTWFVKNTDAANALELVSNQGGKQLGADSNGNVVANDISVFYYNNKIYAYSQKQLYTSPYNWGATWVTMPSKQNPVLTTGVRGESILVDADNNLWIIGGDNSSLVLKGKLNSYNAWDWVPGKKE